MKNSYMPEGMLIGGARNREIIAEGRSGIERAMASGTILESVALLCDNDMNLHVDMNGITGIIPRDEVCFTKNGEKVKDIAIITRVGKPICFKVLDFYERDGRIHAYLSRREAQADCMTNYISKLRPGDIIPSSVTHLEPFGAFVDIGCGIVSLLSVDCISVSRFSHPRDRLRVGERISTVVKSVDRESGRIYVSMRELLGTWEENADAFKTGQTVAGIIRSVESYGVFIELAPNLAGLAELKDGFINSSDMIGKTVAVYVKSIIPERMKIKLVMIDSSLQDARAQRLKYFIDTEKVSHIDYWQYSPDCCPRLIETDFSVE